MRRKSGAEKLFCKKIAVIVAGILLLPAVSGNAQNFKVMFYNVENFFDTVDDPSTNDNSFLPNGENHWTKARFVKKRNNLCKVIAAAGEDRMPDIIGLCEVENKYVLRQLTEETPLAKFDYAIVHYDSPDPRGIDVALLYRKSSFRVVSSSPHGIGRATRDILHVKGIASGKDTIHFFVNHWTSKWSGAASEKGRTAAAKVLKNLVDSIFKTNIRANICLMGDFNDYPDSKPMKILDAKTENSGIGYLYNLAVPLYKKREGTIRYRNRWEMIDQFLVSGNLMFDKAQLRCSSDDMQIFKPDFLMEESSGKGVSLKRTYRGIVYVGGFSDHFPILLNFSGTSSKKNGK
ncbi:MAG: endonuclease [Prevotellaceae bacterium]|jgi:predicted extracellular nuclease|nr:endonuclease [Prevotellaceae bacterium]